MTLVIKVLVVLCLVSTLLLSHSTGSHAESNTPALPTTHPEIARRNLDFSINRARVYSAAKPTDVGAAANLIDALLTRTAFYNSFADLDAAEAECERLLNLRVTEATTHLLCAKVWTSVHRYEQALNELEAAQAAGASRTELERARATLALAVGTQTAPPHIEQIAQDEREAGPSPTATYQELTAHAAALAANDEKVKAEQSYQAALAAYSDVSPYPVAWVFGQLGDLWATDKPTLAAHYYRTALKHLPEYVRINVELAHLEHAAGERASASARLALAARVSRDPDIHANALQLGLEDASPEAVEQIAASFDALLATQPLAFADHAAEFFSGAGANPARSAYLRALLAAEKEAAREKLAAMQHSGQTQDAPGYGH